MKKIVKLFTFVSSVIVLGACTSPIVVNAEEKHQHSYSNEYSYDDIFHWKDADCEHDYINAKKEHEFGDYQLVNAATEYKDGLKIRTCSICGYVEKTAIPPTIHQHTYEEEWTYDTESHWHKASCGDASVIGLDNHKFSDWIIKKEARDEIDGLKYRYCEICDYVEEETIEALEHQHTFTRHWSYNETKHWHDATCLCDLVSEEGEHDFEIDILEPTFESEGLKTFKCKVCKYTYTEVIDQLIHNYSDKWTFTSEYHWHACLDEGYEDLKSDFSSHNYQTIVTPPTYETKGYTTHLCVDCGYRYIDQEVNPLPHNYDEEWLIDEAKGTHYHACIDEGYEDLRGNEASHTYSSKQILVPPTFEEEGYYISTCTVCGFEYKHDYIPVLEHNYSEEWLVDPVKGTHYHACIDEGYEELRGSEESHKYVGKVTSSTFYEEGYTTYTCSVCGDVYVGDYTPKLNSDDFLVYELINDDTEYMVSTSNKDIIELNIPATHEGLPVTKIKEKGFMGCKQLTEVVIPNTIREIGLAAFYNCSKLEAITLPFVGGSVTSENTHLGYIFGASNYTESESYVPASLETVTLSDAITVLPDKAFYCCKKIKCINLPSHLEVIGAYAFTFCERLNGLTLPGTIREMRGAAFLGAFVYQATVNYLGTIDSWASINFADMNSIPLPINKYLNFLFNGEEITELHFQSALEIKQYAFQRFTNITSVDFDSDVTSIGQYAFYDCQGLISVELPDSIISIGNDAFNYCQSLVEVTIPSNLEEIATRTFYDCDSLINVTFNHSLLTINQSAFYDCDSIKQVILNAPLTTICTEAFSNCDNLERAYLPDTLTTVEYRTFFYCPKVIVFRGGSNVLQHDLISNQSNGQIYTNVALENMNIFIDGAEYFINGDHAVLLRYFDVDKTSFTIPTSINHLDNDYDVTVIAPHAFENHEELETIQMQEGLINISQYAFSGCSGLTNIMLPDSVTNVSKYAFQNCSGAYFIGFGSISIINEGTFKGCSSVKAITLTDKIKTLSSSCFEDCSELTTVNNSMNATTINNAFVNCAKLTSFEFSTSSNLTSISGFKGCSSLNNITIPGNITTIGSSCFKDCTSLTNISFVFRTTWLDYGQYCFSGCTALESINMSPRSIHTPRVSTFKDCTSLTSITMALSPNGSSGLNIAESFFQGCTKLVDCDIRGYLKGIDRYAFRDCTSLAGFTIPTPVFFKSIAGDAFKNCPNFMQIFYNDTKAKWNSNVTLSSGWISERFSVDICCSDGIITLKFN